MSDDQHVISEDWCRTSINRVLDFQPAKSVAQGKRTNSYKLNDLWDEEGSAAAEGSSDGLSSPEVSVLPLVMVRSHATMAEAIHDCESLWYFSSREGPATVRAGAGRLMTRPPRFHFIFGNGIALDQYLDRSDLKYCRGRTQTTSKVMSSTEALKDFYNTWFNSQENKVDIEAKFRNLTTTDSACPLMHAMVVAWCTKPKGSIAIVAAVSFRVEQCFFLPEYLLVSDQLFSKRSFGKKADESPFRDVGLGGLLLAFTHVVARAGAPLSVGLDASSMVTSSVFFKHQSEALAHF